MPPYLTDHFRQFDPQIKESYERGFKAGREATIREFKKALESAKKLEAFATFTATTH